MEEEEKDAASELYQFWNNLDMCNDIYCKSDQICIINAANVAVCVEKSRKSSKKCIECSKMDTNDMYCASNNVSYSSFCELIKFNCEQSTDFYPLCQDSCPCDKKMNLNKKLKLDYLWKYFNKNKGANLNIKTNKYAKEYIDHQMKINQKASSTQKKSFKCLNKELNEIGQRLFNWFGVILKNQLRNEKIRSTRILNKIRSSLVRDCDEEVNFIFLSLDKNQDLQLSFDELYHLEHDQREKCLKSYIDSCDTNGDQLLNNNEWCNCFNQYRPCFKDRNQFLSQKKVKKSRLLNAYVPNCDKNGYYESVQCNKFTRTCWCVDRDGNELPNTRKLGKPFCKPEKSLKNQNLVDDDSEIDGDDDFEEDDFQNSVEGSGEEI